MGKIKITRKKFLSTAFAGLAGTKLISKTIIGNQSHPLIRHKVGKTDILVSPVCFGATRTNDESLIKYALDKGINFIDTGRSYANGNNEILVGKAISGIREKVVIQSKIRLEANELPSGGKGKKGADEIRSVLSSKVEASLKALNSDYIDILLYHDASEEYLLFHPEVMKFFAGLKSSGVIRAQGFSTHNDRMNLLERDIKEGFYDVIMVPFNHKGSFVHSVSGYYREWDQNKLISILTEAGNKGIGVIAMKTCSGGKYSTSPDIEPSCNEAVKWVIQHSFISAAAVAMANFEQVDEHIAMLDSL
ncbi:MAG: aldo/keto reductase [Bacteroidales bacterium]|nr:aldo/keto reductase [Bacteroidales bacterium]